MGKWVIFLIFFVAFFSLLGRGFPVKASCIPDSYPPEGGCSLFDSGGYSCQGVYLESLPNPGPACAPGETYEELYSCNCNAGWEYYVSCPTSPAVRDYYFGIGAFIPPTSGPFCANWSVYDSYSQITEQTATNIADCSSWCQPFVFPTNAPTPTPAPVCDSTCGSGVCGVRKSDGTCFNDIGNAIYDLCCCHMSCVPPIASGVCQYIVGENPSGNCNWNCAICVAVPPTPTNTPTLTLTPTPTGACVPACPSAPLQLTPLNLDTVGTSSVPLSWSPPTSWGRVCTPAVENKHYHLYVATFATSYPGGDLKGSDGLLAGFPKLDITGTSFVLDLPDPIEGQKYYWQVYAVNQ